MCACQVLLHSVLGAHLPQLLPQHGTTADPGTAAGSAGGASSPQPGSATAVLCGQEEPLLGAVLRFLNDNPELSVLRARQAAVAGLAGFSLGRECSVEGLFGVSGRGGEGSALVCPAPV